MIDQKKVEALERIWAMDIETIYPNGGADFIAGFSELLGQIGVKRVHDAACGTGWLAVGLAQRGFEVTASDGSPSMVERTKRLMEQHGLSFPIFVALWKELGERLQQKTELVVCISNSLIYAGSWFEQKFSYERSILELERSLTGINSALKENESFLFCDIASMMPASGKEGVCGCEISWEISIDRKERKRTWRETASKDGTVVAGISVPSLMLSQTGFKAILRRNGFLPRCIQIPGSPAASKPFQPYRQFLCKKSLAIRAQSIQ